MHPVRQKQPNAWPDFYNMLGNVWEWCQAEELFEPLPTPRPPSRDPVA